MCSFNDILNIIPSIISFFVNKNKPPCFEESESKEVNKRIDLLLSTNLRDREIGEETFVRGKIKIRNIGEDCCITKIIINDQKIEKNIYVLTKEVFQLELVQLVDDNIKHLIKNIELEMINSRKTKFSCLFDVIEQGWQYACTLKKIKRKSSRK